MSGTELRPSINSAPHSPKCLRRRDIAKLNSDVACYETEALLRGYAWNDQGRVFPSRPGGGYNKALGGTRVSAAHLILKRNGLSFEWYVAVGILTRVSVFGHSGLTGWLWDVLGGF